jgi:hypothetical protein
LTYLRGDRFLIALNLGGRPQRVALALNGTVALSTHLERTHERVGDNFELRPHEGLIVRL